jgi:hypothetical protein
LLEQASGRLDGLTFYECLVEKGDVDNRHFHDNDEETEGLRKKEKSDYVCKESEDKMGK